MEKGCVRQFKVFIASPSDLGQEREAVRAACDALNKRVLVKEKQVMLAAVGWEDAVPSAGRPQETINRLQKECDLFVCLLHKKYGTPTGASGSGTEEEFLNAYGTWKSLKCPKILFYFKEVRISSAKELQDPGLIKVMDLKEKIKADELLLYGEFDSLDRFKTLIREDLEKVIADLTRPEAPNVGATPGPERESVAAVVPEIYRCWLNEKTQCMDIDCLSKGTEVIRVNLPEIFQPLFSQDPDEKAPPGNSKNKGTARSDPSQNSPVEIEVLAARGETLLVSGQAGSGKTTLARHMARSIVNDESPYFPKGLLPVLLYFKDFKAFDGARGLPNGDRARQLLDWYCRSIFSSFLTFETIEAFCQKGRAVFILDGLDEAEKGLREFIVSCFADFRLAYKGVRMVLLGRPHGVGGVVAERFGQRRAWVEDLTQVQVEAFISNWFAHIYDDSRYIGLETADRMKGEIRAREGIDALKTNPLMLTAMCILYNDLKVLPDQRADLYDRFVDRLFSKFGEEKVRVNRFMMDLAHSMFKEEDRSIDHHEALALMKNHFSLGKLDASYGALFDRIEPATGLLHRENGRYKFIHLTFQEFLTATYLLDHVEDSYFDAIEPHVEDERFNEVIPLFIGFLSMKSSGAANKIIEKIFKQAPQPGGAGNHLVAAQSLMDIHRDNRKPATCSLAIDRMQTLVRSGEAPGVRFRAGKFMGHLGYDEGYQAFVPIDGGVYSLEGLGKTEMPAFEISKFPVTNAWFNQFMAGGGYENRKFWSKQGSIWLETAKVKEPRLWRERKYNCPNGPVVGVNWYEASAFCAWLDVKEPGFSHSLPTEAQWQAAAAGKEKREYPWGKEIEPQICNYNETGLGGPSPVGVFLDGKTPEGVHDLGGNVWEWTRTGYHQKEIFADFPYDPEIEKLFENSDIEKYFKLLKDEKKDSLSCAAGPSSISVVVVGAPPAATAASARAPGSAISGFVAPGLNFEFLPLYPLMRKRNCDERSHKGCPWADNSLGPAALDHTPVGEISPLPEVFAGGPDRV
ncbi:conserved hypothetical protein [Desulforapulum autotrophicum HRM2]|uniref:NACHT domain-containing protein n=1 Tax=Desulforapulum autotrophicum (strain ATCC 43914 / DSM 3382 / VKM B-1955 / HRM2) TaxID=177437 RepID=C0QMG6_DESAH|nr:SUMF1/EgtB/PvdO family nonheme iron enzyme [Desulforapulum autotrophicum]ACN16483.1 conserved hypothetical protein [Desulforapulum autotrophicum HRM2]